LSMHNLDLDYLVKSTEAKWGDTQTQVTVDGSNMQL